MSYVKTLDLKRGIKLLQFAQEQEEKEVLFRYYLTVMPYFDKKNYVTFEQYCEQNRPTKVALDNRPLEEIMDELMKSKKRK